jgi:two-component system sporulation sensor kinase B
VNVLAELQDLLLNLFFMITPVFIYHLIWDHKRGLEFPREIYKAVSIGACAIASGAMSLVFPIHTTYYPGIPIDIDLSLIPIILCFLYADRVAGMTAAVLLLLVQLLIAHDGVSFLVHGARMAVPLALWLLNPSFRQWGLKNKLLFLLQLSLFSSLLLAFLIVQVEMPDSALPGNPRFLLIYVLVHVGFTLLTVGLIETLIRLTAVRDNLQRMEKLDILSELAASVAHEIRNPLTTAHGFVQLLNEMPIGDPIKKDMYCDMILQELHRTQSVINDYMSLAKPQAEKKEAIDLDLQSSLLIDALSPFAMMRNVEMEKVYTSAEPLAIFANREKFVQCMMNLMKNGIESMEQGGRLQLSIGSFGDMVYLDVTDNGTGMTEREVKQLGEPFYSTKKKGTGLGMMLVFRIVEGMGGTLHISSKKGKGTHCRVLVPMYRSPSAGP